MLDIWQDEQSLRDLGQRLIINAIRNCAGKRLNDCLIEELDKIIKEHLDPWFDREISAAEALFLKELTKERDTWAPSDSTEHAAFLKQIELLHYDETPDTVSFVEFSPEDCFKHGKDVIVARFYAAFNSLWETYKERMDKIWEFAMSDDDSY